MTHSKILLFAVFTLFSLSVFGQMGVAYELNKPQKFESRVLASEKSNTGKKIKKPRRFVQNTITHYNYFFNANVKLDMVVARAKAQNRDDYTRLLPFYNYSLDATSAQKKELDSVIYKCTMGILIHDTRNDWIDNLYMLIGKTYYLKKDFDSAYITFQFINYAFAPKEDDGYDKPIGSNANRDEGGSADIVSTKEKRNILQKAFSLPPSRNESLIWKVRTYLAKDQFPEASSLIEILRRDPLFPQRLQPSLNEVRALYFYKQNVYDSAAFYLERALPAAENNEEEARWEYLIAQLYERVNRSYEAKTFYERTVRHTYDPVLEIYARLNSIRQNKEGGEDFIQKNIQALVSMAKKDRYESYRDIIYYTAAQMELERKNRPGAEAFLLLCTRASATNGGGTQRNKAFLQLANMSFEDKKYRAAKNYYDSLNVMEVAALSDVSWLPDRKAALAIIVTQLLVLERQDSLQRIAALPPDQRDAYVKKLARTLRRQQGLRDDDQSEPSGNNSAFNNPNAPAPDLFNTGSGNQDWYFNNASLKARGYTDFKTKWGNRPNVDNWQLTSLVKQQQLAKLGDRPATVLPDLGGKAGLTGPDKIDFKSLMANLPLTPEKLKKLNDSVDNALFTLGKAYQEGIADYSSAINAYDSLLERSPDFPRREETLFSLYYCYKKMGDETNAQRILALMKQKYPSGKLTGKAVNPDSAENASNSLKVNATHQYEKIYNSFIEGRFEEALALKKTADSLYGDKYWTPQLLYIESVYYIRNREDGRAIATLTNITSKYPKTPMAAKAATLIDVLKRRKQIEDYLTNLQVTRVPDDSIVIDATPTPGTTGEKGTRLVRNDSNMLVKEDTSQLARARVHAPPSPAAQGGKKPTPTVAGMDKLKVDTTSLNSIKMDAGQLAALQRQVDSINAAMQKAAADSLEVARLRHQSDSIQTAVNKLKADTAQLLAKVRSSNSAFDYTPEKPHSVMILLEKVDPVYVTETRNAFNRYNQENYYGQSLTIDNSSVSDTLKLVVIGSFPNAAAAQEYMHKAQAAAPREVVPWLPADKYSFFIISGPNLELLLNNRDMPAYKRFDKLVNPNERH
ncbi:MAG TPA: tetratricopeptide repeat protein [Puia sp.]|nr:tetratricopeptide repeat protein [Puia sp.]